MQPQVSQVNQTRKPSTWRRVSQLRHVGHCRPEIAWADFTAAETVVRGMVQVAFMSGRFLSNSVWAGRTGERTWVVGT
jgi:hypothetical protein